MFARIKRVNSTGKGMILTFPTEPVTNPPAGTELFRTSGTDYTSGYYIDYNNVRYWGQYADYVTYADGYGGVFYSWENVNYKSGYIFSASDTTYVSVYTDRGYENYPSGGVSYDEYWDGMGSAYGTNYNYSYASGYITQNSNPTANSDLNYAWVDDGNYGGGYYPQYCYYLQYLHDGNGGYYTSVPESAYYPSGYFTGVYNYWMPSMPPDGNTYWSGKYCKVVWNGGGGSYIDYGTVYGDFWPSGTEYWGNDVNQKTSVYIINYGSTSDFDNGKTDHNHYYWNGSGGAYNSSWTDGNYYPLDYNPFLDDGSHYYYWDGNGNYFTESY